MVIKAPDVKRKRTYPDHGTRDSGCVGETRTRKGIAHNTKFFKKKSSLNVGHRPDQETGKGNAHDTKLFRKGNSLKGVREPGKGTWKGNVHDTKLFRKGNSLKGVRKPDKGTWKGKGHGAELLKTRSYPKGAASIPDNSVSLEGNGSKKFPHSMRGFSEKSCESHQSMCFSGKVKNATVLNGKSKNKEKMAIHIDSVQANDFASDSRKQHGKNKSGNCSNASPTKIANKTAQHKNSLDENSEGMHDHPKKKRRRIRLDPFDISNKRLEDEIATSECLKDKKEDSEKEIKLSKNAQFRAIKPSPSILSFVEDNLLGRRRMVELQRAGYNVDLPAPLDTIPFSTGTERAPIEDNVFKNKLSFFAAAKVSSSFPPPVLPEVAFAGRSNVGKSSLLNALTRQWGVVRTSDKPGHTQTINFFKVGSKLCLVDLPGYGFAYAKEEAKDAWEELVKEYVSERDSQKHVCLLIDTKWGMKPRDHDLINLMERSQTKYQIVLTKTDTVFPIDVARRAMQIEESLKANSSIIQPMMMISSKTGAGIRSLRTMLAKIARYAKV